MNNAQNLGRLAESRLADTSKTAKPGAGPQESDMSDDNGAVRPIVLHGFTLLEDGLVADGRPTLDQYAEVGEFVTYAEKASPFWLADWLAYGDGRADWQARLSQVQHVTGYSEETVRKIKYVGESIPRSRRRARDLSFAHHQAVAPLRPEQQTLMLHKAIESGWTREELRREVRALQRQGVIEGQAELLGQYRVVVCEPRWPTHARGMSIADLCKLPVAAHTQKNAVLFLWVPPGMLLATPGPRDVLDAWGFEYRSNIVWDYVRGVAGTFMEIRHEHLLICTRGECPPDVHVPQQPSVVTIRRSPTSTDKPEEVLALIERTYTRGPYLHLGGRLKRDGWSRWNIDPQESAQEKGRAS